MGHKNTIYIPIQAMVKGFASGSEASLNDISNRIAQAIKPFMQSLRLKIDPSSITSVQQLEKYLRSINATITQTGNGFTIMAQSANGLQGVVHLTQQEGQVLAQTTSLTAQRVTITQQLQQTYDSLRKSIMEKNRLEKEGNTNGQAYSQTIASVEAYEAELNKIINTLQQRYRVQMTYNDELQKEVIAGNGTAAKIMRENEYRLQLLNTIHQEAMARQSANAARQQEEASANQYLSVMNQVLSAEVRLATMKQGGSTPQAIAAQQQYINLLRQKAAALKANITDEEILTRVEQELAIAKAKTNAQMQQGSVAIKKQQSLFGSLVASMKMVIKTALLYSIAYGAIYKIVEATQATIDTVKELDKAIVDLRIVTGGTQEEAEKLLSTYNKMAQELGSTTTEVSKAAVEWQRQGYSLADTNKLIENSMILSKVGMIESAEAQKYLTSAMKGYNVSVNESLGIVDKLTAIDLNAAVSAGDLAEAMSRTAASANLAGVEMDELLGYMAVVGEVTQKSMSSVGESFKTLFARFGQIKAGKFVDEETGENLNDIAKVLSQFDIALYDAEGNMNDVSNILSTLANKWDKLNDTERNALATSIAGVRQRENFLVLMENYGKAVEYTADALNSAGTAEEKFGAYTEGIEAKINSMKASLEGWASNLIDSDLIKGIIDATTGLIKFADTFKIVQILFIGLMALAIPKLFLAIVSGLSRASASAIKFVATQQGVAMAMKGNANAAVVLNNLMSYNAFTLSGLSQQQITTTLTSTGLINAFKGLTKEEIINTLATMGVSEELQVSTAQKILNILATNGQTISIKALTQATWLHIEAMLKEIATMVIAHPIISAIVAAIALLTAGLIYVSQAEERLAKKVEETSEAHEEAKSKVEETTSALEENKKRIEELEAQGSLTYVEQEELKKLKEATAELEWQLHIQKEKAKTTSREEARARRKQYENLDKDIDLNPQKASTHRTGGAGKARPHSVEDTRGSGAIENYIYYTKQLETATGEAASEIQAKLDKLFPEVQKYLNTYSEYITSLDNMSEEDLLIEFGEDYKQDIQKIKDEYQKLMLALFPEQYKKIKWEQVLGMDEFSGAIEKLQEWVNAGLSEEEILQKLKEAYPNLIAKLKEFGIEEDEIIDQFKKQEQGVIGATNSLEDFKKQLESLNSIYETLNSTIEEYNSNGSISYDTWEKLIDLEDKYLSVLVDENGQIKSNNQALKDLIKTKIEDATLTRIETYVGNLVTAAQNGTLKSTLDLTEKIEWNTNARLANVMATIASNKALMGNKEQILKTISAMLQLSSSVSIGGDSTSKAAKETEKWEKVLEFTNKTLDDHIEKLEQEREAIEKNIEEQIKAKEKEIELLEAEKEALQDKNEEKNKEIELEELQRNLQKAQQRTMRVYYEGKGWVWEQDPEALQKAQQELDDFYAEQEINNIDKKIEALEKEVEALEKTTDEEEDSYDARLKMLDEQIKKAEEYKNKWNEVKEDYEHQQNAIIATQILGANAEKDILNQREGVLNTFKINYTSALAKVAKETEKSTNRVNTALSGIDFEALNKMFAMQNIEGYTGASTTLVALAKKTFKGESGLEYRYDTASKRYYLASSIQKTTLNGKEVEVVAPNSAYYAKPYASGTLSARAGLANVDEKGRELIVPKQGRYRMMEYGDTVVPHNFSQRLFEVASNPLRFVANALNSVKTPILSNNSNQTSSSIINIGTIELPSVTNGDNFIKQLQIIAANR